MGKAGLLAAGAAALAILVAAAIWVRTRREEPPPPPHPPSVSLPAAPVFHEQLDGPRYRNQDLRLSFSAPEGWTGALGNRSQDRSPYEGLVVRMSPEGTQESGRPQTFVSVVKRTLPPAAPRDPLAYIAREVLTAEKTVTDAPVMVTLSGRRVGKVGFEVRSGTGALRVLQVVYLTSSEAIVLTATAPSAAFDGLRGKFEQVFESLKLES